jgi:hypothetical protein
MHTHLPAWTLWLIVPLFAIRLVFRLRRFLAYQRLVVRREMWSSGLLLTGVIALAVVCAEESGSLKALGAGLLAGAVLGAGAAWRTRIDRKPDGPHFQPSPYFGAALASLLLGRIVWRLVTGPDGTSGWTAAEFLHNASTLFLFGLFAAYYLAFSAGLIRSQWREGR